MYTKTTRKSGIVKNKISIVALLALLVISICAGLYVSSSGIPLTGESGGDTDGPIEDFNVMASISDASLNTSSGSVSAIGVDFTSTTLQTSNQTGDESVDYSFTIGQNSASVTAGGGSTPGGYGDEKVTTSGSQSASSSGSENYGGSTMNDDLSINLSDPGASTLANDVSVNPGQTIDFSFNTGASATLKSNTGGNLNSSSTSGSVTATISDKQASIDNFNVNGDLNLQE